MTANAARRIGPVLVFERFWKEPGCRNVIEDPTPMPRAAMASLSSSTKRSGSTTKRETGNSTTASPWRTACLKISSVYLSVIWSSSIASSASVTTSPWRASVGIATDAWGIWKMSGAEAKFAFSYASSRAARAFTSEVEGRLGGEAQVGESLPPSVIPGAWRREFNARARSPWRRVRRGNLLDKSVELDALAKPRRYLLHRPEKIEKRAIPR